MESKTKAAILSGRLDQEQDEKMLGTKSKKKKVNRSGGDGSKPIYVKSKSEKIAEMRQKADERGRRFGIHL